MATGIPEGLEELITCPICCEQYQDPRVLPCLHTYCKGCLERCLAQSTTISCPECRSSVEIPDINELKVNFQINHLSSLLKDTKSPAIPQKPSYCPKHREVLKVFCETCEKLICCECTMVDHKGHQFGYLEEIVKKRKAMLSQGIKKANAIKEKVNAVLRNVHDLQKRAKKNKMDIEKEIDDAIDKQIQALEEKRTNLKQELSNITDEKALKSQEYELLLHITKLENAIKVITEGLTSGSDSKVVSMSKEALVQLSQVKKKQFNEKPSKVATPRLKIDTATLSHEIKVFAEIIDDSIRPDDNVRGTKAKWKGKERKGDGKGPGKEGGVPPISPFRRPCPPPPVPPLSSLPSRPVPSAPPQALLSTRHSRPLPSPPISSPSPPPLPPAFSHTKTTKSKSIG